MKLILNILILFAIIGSNHIYRNSDWKIQVDLSKTKFSTDTCINYDALLKSNFCKFTLPEVRCEVEHIFFKPKVRIFDKYLPEESVDSRKVYKTLYDYLSKKYEVLYSEMLPDNLGQSFVFVVEKEKRYLFKYHLIEVDKRNILVESVKTFGTGEGFNIELQKLIKGIKLTK